MSKQYAGAQYGGAQFLGAQFAGAADPNAMQGSAVFGITASATGQAVETAYSGGYLKKEKPLVIWEAVTTKPVGPVYVAPAVVIPEIRAIQQKADNTAAILIAQKRLAYQQAKSEIYSEAYAKLVQEQEDEQIAAIVAALC